MSRRRVFNEAGDLTEAAFQRRVVRLARAYGWRIYHAPDNRPAVSAKGKRQRPQSMVDSTAKGFPDLVLLRDQRLIVAELKTRTGRLRPGQREWLDTFAELGDRIVRLDGTVAQEHRPQVKAYVWRPSDWDELHEILRGVGTGFVQERRHDLDPMPGEPPVS